MYTDTHGPGSSYNDRRSERYMGFWYPWGWVPNVMRIAMISEHASPLAAIAGVDAGGQNIHVARLAAALAGRGHTVHVYTRRDDEALPERVTTADGYVVHHVPAGPPVALPKDDLLPYMREFGRWLAAAWSRADAPHLVHAHFWMSGVAAAEAIQQVPRPLVVTYHALGSVKRRMQGAADPSPRERLELERMVAQTAARVIAQCSDEVRELAGYGVERNRISVVPSGVDTDVFRPGEPSEMPSSPPRVLTVGRMVERKGFAEVVKALPGLPRAELVVAGGPAQYRLKDDPVACDLMSLAHRLGVADRVRLLGSVAPEQMPHWYRSADVVACTPAYEPFGITPLEAMACGTPVVAYRVGGLQDTVVDGQTGALVAPGDVAELTRRLQELLADNELRLACGKAARLRTEEHYPWPRIAERIEQVYTRALATAPAHALV